MSSKNSKIILATVSLIALSTVISSCTPTIRREIGESAGSIGRTVDNNTNRAGKAATDVTRLNDELANSAKSAKLENLRTTVLGGAAGGGVVVTASLFIGQNAYGEVSYNCKSGKLNLPPLPPNAPKVDYTSMINQMKLSCGRG
ncbi:MAG: hypothetical protein ACK5XC_17610 [Pseudanabaena sp.]|jgi:hypothetical protein